MSLFVLGHGAGQVAQGTDRLVGLVIAYVEIGQLIVGDAGVILLAKRQVYLGEAVDSKRVCRFGAEKALVSGQGFGPLAQAKLALGHVALGRTVAGELAEGSAILFDGAFPLVGPGVLVGPLHCCVVNRFVSGHSASRTLIFEFAGWQVRTSERSKLLIEVALAPRDHASITPQNNTKRQYCALP